MKTNVHFCLYLAQFFLEREMFQANLQRKSKHILCSKTFFFFIVSLFEIMWKNIVEPGRPRMTIWRVRIACWIPKATNTHSRYVTLVAFPL